MQLERVGLVVNVNTMMLREVQPLQTFETDGGLKTTILKINVAQKGLGCMLTAAG